MFRLIPLTAWTVYGRWGTPAMFSRVKGAVIHHSVTVNSGDSISDARTVERVIWGRRIKSKFAMVAYNFLITVDGTVFEGRGFKWRNGANNRTRILAPLLTNRTTISICFVGNYHPGVAGVATITPTPQQIKAAAALIRHGVSTGQIKPNPQIVPHSKLHATACCGNNLRTRIPDIIRQVQEPTIMANAPATSTTLPGTARTDFLAGVELGISAGTNPAELAPRDQAITFAYRGYAKAAAHADKAADAAAQEAISVLTAALEHQNRIIADLTARIVALETAPTQTGPFDVRVVAVGAA